MDAKTAAKFLQTQINRYVKVTGLAPLAVDGAIGKATAYAAKSAVNEILTLCAPHLESGAAEYKSFHQLAWGYLNQIDQSAPTTVINIAYALADFLQKFGNFQGPPILKDSGTPSTATSVVTTSPKPTAPSTTTTPRPPVPSIGPSIGPTMVTPPGAAASINFLGLKLPRMALYIGGGVFALALVALVATRKKSTPSAAVAGSEWWEADDVDPDVQRIHRESRERTRQRIREVSSSKRAALAWLEQVGSWPSSDPDVRKITAAAERRVARG